LFAAADPPKIRRVVHNRAGYPQVYPQPAVTVGVER
jgi:hypothetical protein